MTSAATTADDLRRRLERIAERSCDVPRVCRPHFAALVDSMERLLDQMTGHDRR